MRAYVITTALVFGLLVAMHVVRVVAEGWHVATNPGFIITTVAATGLCLWGMRLVRKSARS